MSGSELDALFARIENPGEGEDDDDEGRDEPAPATPPLRHRRHLLEYLLGLEFGVPPRPGHPSEWPLAAIRDYRACRQAHARAKAARAEEEASADQSWRFQQALTRQMREGM